MAGSRNSDAGADVPGDEGRERPVSGEQRTRRPGREISGPGAADFLAASGGLDMPENDPSKGTGALRGEGLVDRERLVPNLDEPDPTSEREVLTPDASTPGKKKQN
jgi:hypothetical protein